MTIERDGLITISFFFVSNNDYKDVIEYINGALTGFNATKLKELV